MSAPDAYAAARRRRVLSRFAARLGGRVALVGDVPDLRTVHPLVRCRSGGGGDVRARPDAIPVASGALTGIVVVAPVDGTTATLLEECARLLQPGGHALVVGELRDAAAFAACAETAGLEQVGRAPVGALPAATALPEPLWSLAALRDRFAVRLRGHGDRPVEVVAVLRREGGDRIEIPGMAAMLRQSVWPSRAARP